MKLRYFSFLLTTKGGVMTPEQILQSLVSQGLNAVQVTLQKITHSNGSTWAYSNSTPREPVDVFGGQDTNISYSSYDLRTKTSSKKSDIKDGVIHTFWLNTDDDATAEIYADDFGDTAVCLVVDDKPRLLTWAQAQQEFPVASNAQDATPQQPNA
tara:strand:+ start:47 stop:511 length:465 start_codon:yes stop_codon:yes gene_type:complete